MHLRVVLVLQHLAPSFCFDTVHLIVHLTVNFDFYVFVVGYAISELHLERPKPRPYAIRTSPGLWHPRSHATGRCRS